MTQHRLTTTGQIGDGREAAAADYVERHARPGDIDDVLDTIDEYAYRKSFLVNIGDEKGLLLDAAVRRADPELALELGTYCGYGALRIARAAPAARVISVELAEANAQVARRIWAGLVFLDHNKERYLPDLRTIMDQGWLRPGAVVVADNVRLPGSPRYRAYMREQQGITWRTTEHKTHGEYGIELPDLVLESVYLGG